MRGIILLVVTTASAAAASGKWERSLTAALTGQAGNTDLISYSAALSTEYTGDVKWGGVNLKDCEIRLALAQSRGKLGNALYQHDGNASFLFDVMAHERFSPFFLSYWSYDSSTALLKRIQLGAGGKYSFLNGFSVSMAYLWEVEEYRKERSTTQFRLSIRPKYKRTFDSGMSINYVIFVQPFVRDFDTYLIDNQFSLSIPTFSQKLKLSLIWLDKYNSQPPRGIKKRDTDLNLGITFSF